MAGVVRLAAGGGRRRGGAGAAAARRAGLLALGGLARCWRWTLGLARVGAAVGAGATTTPQRLALYLGALIAAAALLRDRRGAARCVEPALAAGALAVVGYGLSERAGPVAGELERSSAPAGGSSSR